MIMPLTTIQPRAYVWVLATVLFVGSGCQDPSAKVGLDDKVATTETPSSADQAGDENEETTTATEEVQGGFEDPEAPPKAESPSPNKELRANEAVLQDQQAMKARLTGEVTSPRKSMVAFQVGGFVSSVKFRTGLTCKKGDVLAFLDKRDYELGVQLARAKRDLARVTLRTAKKEFEREEQLKKENVSTATVYEQVKGAFQQAQLNLKLAELQLEQAEEALDDTMLKAPYDCVVTQQLKHEGENVQPGTAVFEVYDTSSPEISLSAPERLMGSIKVGDLLDVTVPSTGYKGAANVTRVVPVVNQKTRTFEVVAKLSSPSESIVPGLYAEASLR